VCEKTRKTVGCFESKTHPSIFRESVDPSALPAFSFVARNEKKRDVLFSFHLFVSFRVS
jgi:hypothetical protein